MKKIDVVKIHRSLIVAINLPPTPKCPLRSFYFILLEICRESLLKMLVVEVCSHVVNTKCPAEKTAPVFEIGRALNNRNISVNEHEGAHATNNMHITQLVALELVIEVLLVSFRKSRAIVESFQLFFPGVDFFVVL
jgi:hypothetical protein